MKKALVFCFIIVSALACKKTDTTNRFAGNWKGTFDGSGDHGNFTVKIATNGSIIGSIYAVVAAETYNATGSVSNGGQVTISAGTSISGISLTGSMKDTTATGTWTNTASYIGTWLGYKYY